MGSDDPLRISVHEEKKQHISLPKSTIGPLIWNYFKVIEGDKRQAKCNFCRKLYKYKTLKNTVDLRNHLKTKHKSLENVHEKMENNCRKKIAVIPSTQIPIQTLAPVQFIDPNLTPQKIPIFPIPRPAPVIDPNESKPRLKNNTSKQTIKALKKYGIYKGSN